MILLICSILEKQSWGAGKTKRQTKKQTLNYRGKNDDYQRGDGG